MHHRPTSLGILLRIYPVFRLVQIFVFVFFYPRALARDFCISTHYDLNYRATPLYMFTSSSACICVYPQFGQLNLLRLQTFPWAGIQASWFGLYFITVIIFVIQRKKKGKYQKLPRACWENATPFLLCLTLSFLYTEECAPGPLNILNTFRILPHPHLDGTKTLFRKANSSYQPIPHSLIIGYLLLPCAFNIIHQSSFRGVADDRTSMLTVRWRRKGLLGLAVSDLTSRQRLVVFIIGIMGNPLIPLCYSWQI